MHSRVQALECQRTQEKQSSQLHFLQRILGENSNRSTKAMARAHEVLKSHTLKSLPKQQKLWRNMRGRTRRTPRTPRCRSTRFPYLEEISLGGEYRYRSPLSFPSKRSKNHRRERE